MPLNVQRARALLQGVDFPSLFIGELGWFWPASRKAAGLTRRGVDYARIPVAQLPARHLGGLGAGTAEAELEVT